MSEAAEKRDQPGGENERRRQRTAILRELGVPQPWDVAQSPRKFRDVLQKLGVDPAAYGDLGVAKVGGRQRGPDTPEALKRRARYAYLRSCGVESYTATHRAVSVGQFAFQVRKERALAAAQGRELPPMPEGLDT